MAEREPTEPASLIPAEMLEAAVDPSLPAGVIGIEDSSGNMWRYPLAEFAVEEGSGDG